MPDITLTITLDEASAYVYVDTYAHVDAAEVQEVRRAIAAALPPEPPKEGEVWADGIGVTEIGPIKWGAALVRRQTKTGDDAIGAVKLDVMAESGWTKVR